MKSKGPAVWLGSLSVREHKDSSFYMKNIVGPITAMQGPPQLAGRKSKKVNPLPSAKRGIKPP